MVLFIINILYLFFQADLGMARLFCNPLRVLLLLIIIIYLILLFNIIYLFIYYNFLQILTNKYYTFLLLNNKP
jgi:hypothetical protein